MTANREDTDEQPQYLIKVCTVICYIRVLTLFLPLFFMSWRYTCSLFLSAALQMEVNNMGPDQSHLGTSWQPYDVETSYERRCDVSTLSRRCLRLCACSVA